MKKPLSEAGSITFINVSIDTASTSNLYRSDRDPGLSQRRAIQQGIHQYTYSTNTNDSNSALIPLLPPIPPQCSTPSCRFPLFSSLAICADTADISPRLSISRLSSTTAGSDRTTTTAAAAVLSVLGFLPDTDGIQSIRNASLPNGAYLLGSPETCNLNISSPSSLRGGGDRRRVDDTNYTLEDGNIDKTRFSLLSSRNATLAFMDQPDKLSASIANFFVIYATTTTTTNQTTTVISSSSSEEKTAFGAVEVLFHFCVNTYNVSVTQGIPTSEVINSTTDVAQITTTSDDHNNNSNTKILHLRDPLFFDSSSSNNTNQTTTTSGYLSVNLTAAQILQNQLASLIGGTYSSSLSGGHLIKGLTPASEVLGAAMVDLGSSSTNTTGNASNGDGDGDEDGETTAAGLQHRKMIGDFMQNVATSLTNA